jgi:hypothetical protein
MIPTIASSGSSFRGAAAYYLHDKDADTTARVAWTHTDNLLTDDPHRAWKIMTWTARNQATLKAAAGVRASGRKLEKPVFAFSVSWHPEQKPDKAHMLATVKAAAAVLGLSEHQTIYVSHNDEEHAHVHALFNRVHPLTGKAATLSRSKEKLAAWALAYERQHGKIYCATRERNARRRTERKPGREGDPVILDAWKRSDSGKSFQAALKAKGYTLAQGNRRLVVVDRYGKAVNPVRQLPDVRAAQFKSRIRDLNLLALPKAATAQQAARKEQRRQYHASRRFDRWSADYLNRNQDRQLEERAAMQIRYEKRLDDKRREQAQFYKRAELVKSIDALKERTERPALLQRLIGRAARDRAALEAQERQLADVDQRIAEQLGAITTERDLAFADQRDRHARENELAREYIAERQPSFYAEERTVEEQQQQRLARGGGRNRNDDEGGRERVYHRYTPLPWGIF